MKRQLLSVGLLVLASIPLYAQQDDIEARAMKDEMQRSMKDLHLESKDAPYYIAYKIVDIDRKVAQASLGSLTSSGETHNRVLTVTVRVGSYDFDNSNFNGGGLGAIEALLGSLGGGANVLPVDDNYDELRRKIWLATDAAYKKAVEDLSAKKAADQNRNHAESIPSFSKETPRQELEALPPIDVRLADAERLVHITSAVFRNSPLIESGTAEFEVDNDTERFLNSEGTSYLRRTPEVYFHASASLQNSAGETFTDVYSAHARSLSALPSETELTAATKEISNRLLVRMSGKTAKRYNGPVLVEGKAADELFAHYFAVHLLAHHSESGTNSLLALLSGTGGTGSTTNLLNKIGSRVLPNFLTVVDNPQLTQLDGQPLFGNYKFDEEGVLSQETTLVSNGMLKTLLNSRTPVRGIHQSSGNMRELGVQPGNLLVTASTSSTREDLRKQLISLITTRGLEYGIIVRRLSGTTAIEAVRIYPDGHEEVLRDARLAEVALASFKDILAVSTERTLYSEHVQGTALYANADLVSYVVPDMLFEDMTIERTSENTPKPPVISSPLFSN